MVAPNPYSQTWRWDVQKLLNDFNGTSGTFTGTGAAGGWVTLISTDPGSTAGPALTLDRQSASPAANDLLGIIYHYGRNSANASIAYSYEYTIINDPTAGSESSQYQVTIYQGGTQRVGLLTGGTNSQFNGNAPTGGLTLSAGTYNTGANIELYGPSHATLPNRAYYDADLHTFRTVAAASTSISAAGMQFAASQVNSADPRCFDDYEEGTWTPSYQWSTPGTSTFTYDAANRYGMYTKWGRLYYLNYRVIITATTVGTAAGSLYVVGIPFTSAAAYSTAATYSTGFTTQAPDFILHSSTVLTQMYHTATSVAGIGVANSANTMAVIGSLTHYTT